MTNLTTAQDRDAALVRKMKSTIRKQDTFTLQRELELKKAQVGTERIVALIEAELARRS